MQEFKRVLFQLPEFLLIIAVIIYWNSTGIASNPIAIVLIIGLIFQIIFKNRIIGIIIPSLFAVISFYMLFALVSEVNNFLTFNADAKRLLFIGLSYFISIIIVSGVMIYNYSSMNPINNRQIDTL